jgi:hypothetical protein
MVMATLEKPTVNKIENTFFKRVAIFSGLDDPALERIGGLMAVREVKKHEIIWLEQEPAIASDTPAP